MAAYSDSGSDGDVFRALADPSRRQLLDSLNARDGQTLSELCAGLEMQRQSVSKHLDILEASNLVTTLRRGREKLHFLNPAPISDLGERWIRRYDAPRVDALAGIKRTLEAHTVDTPSFVYKTYIRTTPELLWRALTEPAFTERYWGTTLETDWQVGSPIKWTYRDITITDPEQVVLEAEPYRRLSYRWPTMTDEFAASLDLSDEARDRLAAEPHSTVTFDIEDVGTLVKLIVVHGGFVPESLTIGMISEGWPRVLSDLKTLLETGDLPAASSERSVSSRLGLTTN